MAETKLTMEQFNELLATALETKIKELGLDKVDLKHGIIPTEEEKDGAPVDSKLSKVERFKSFLSGVINKDIGVVKAMGGDTNPAGGFLIPDEFKAELIKGLSEAAIMRKLVKVVPVSERTGEYPVLGSSVNATWHATYDNVAFGESNPVFANLVYTVKRLDVFSAMSKELLNDAKIDLESLIRDLFVEAFAKAEDEAIISGDGTTIPIVGLTNNTNIPETALTSGLTYDDLISVFYSLKRPYRQNAVFMTSSLGIQILRKIKDDNGLPILVPATQGGDFNIFGRPVVENPYMTDTLVDPDGTPSSGDEYYTAGLIVGYFKNVFLFDREEFAVEMSDQAGDSFVKNQLLIKASNRLDMNVAFPQESFVRLTGLE